jgi:hypothetical protein
MRDELDMGGAFPLRQRGRPFLALQSIAALLGLAVVLGGVPLAYSLRVRPLWGSPLFWLCGGVTGLCLVALVAALRTRELVHIDETRVRFSICTLFRTSNAETPLAQFTRLTGWASKGLYVIELAGANHNVSLFQGRSKEHFEQRLQGYEALFRLRAKRLEEDGTG